MGCGGTGQMDMFKAEDGRGTIETAEVVRCLNIHGTL